MQVGTLSSSPIPRLGLSVFFLSFSKRTIFILLPPLVWCARFIYLFIRSGPARRERHCAGQAAGTTAPTSPREPSCHSAQSVVLCFVRYVLVHRRKGRAIHVRVSYSQLFHTTLSVTPSGNLAQSRAVSRNLAQRSTLTDHGLSNSKDQRLSLSPRLPGAGCRAACIRYEPHSQKCGAEDDATQALRASALQ